MVYTLMVITAAASINVGSFDTIEQCKAAQRDANRQQLQAICVMQESPEQALLKMKLLFRAMKKMMEEEE